MHLFPYYTDTIHGAPVLDVDVDVDVDGIAFFSRFGCVI